MVWQGNTLVADRESAAANFNLYARDTQFNRMRFWYHCSFTESGKSQALTVFIPTLEIHHG
jgi:hypothetical protein